MTALLLLLLAACLIWLVAGSILDCRQEREPATVCQFCSGALSFVWSKINNVWERGAICQKCNYMDAPPGSVACQHCDGSGWHTCFECIRDFTGERTYVPETRFPCRHCDSQGRPR